MEKCEVNHETIEPLFLNVEINKREQPGDKSLVSVTQDVTCQENSNLSVSSSKTTHSQNNGEQPFVASGMVYCDSRASRIA